MVSFGRTQAPPKEFFLEKDEGMEDEFSNIPKHNIQRKAALVEAGPINHMKSCYFVYDKDFDLNRTIFASVSGLMGFKRMQMTARLGNKLMWDPKVADKIEKEFEEYEKEAAQKLQVIKTPDWNNYQGLLEFMKTDCNFRTEHADGSFMDHLYFCRDYSAAHFSQHSPRILFLHSICGVGSNIFPMSKDQLGKLESMLTPIEFKQICAFPSLLRLINKKDLTQELLAANAKGSLDQIESITFHRVIDNENITLSAEELWVALNFQLIHQIDFLPSTNWSTQIDDPLFQVFVEIYDMLQTTKKIDAEVHFDMKQARNLNEKDEFGMPVTLATVISRYAPKSLKRSQLRKTIINYSKAIGHDLSYEIKWNN